MTHSSLVTRNDVDWLKIAIKRLSLVVKKRVHYSCLLPFRPFHSINFQDFRADYALTGVALRYIKMGMRVKYYATHIKQWWGLRFNQPQGTKAQILGRWDNEEMMLWQMVRAIVEMRWVIMNVPPIK
jgi:hypothetical protein